MSYNNSFINEFDNVIQGGSNCINKTRNVEDAIISINNLNNMIKQSFEKAIHYCSENNDDSEIDKQRKIEIYNKVFTALMNENERQLNKVKMGINITSNQKLEILKEILDDSVHFKSLIKELQNSFGKDWKIRIHKAIESNVDEKYIDKYLKVLNLNRNDLKNSKSLDDFNVKVFNANIKNNNLLNQSSYKTFHNFIKANNYFKENFSNIYNIVNKKMKGGAEEYNSSTLYSSNIDLDDYAAEEKPTELDYMETKALKTKLDKIKKVEKSLFSSLESVVREIYSKIEQSLNTIFNATKQGKVSYSEDLKMWMNTLNNFPDYKSENVKILAGEITSNKDEIEQIKNMFEIRKFQEATKIVMDKGNSSFKDLNNSLNDLVNIYEKYNTNIVQQFKENPNLLTEEPRLYSYDVKTGGASGISLEKIKKDIIYFLQINNVQNNMKSMASEMDNYMKRYNTLDGYETAQIINNINHNWNLYIDSVRDKDQKKFYKLKCQTDKDVVRACAAIDLYLANFNKEVLKNPKLLTDLNDIVNNVTVINKWTDKNDADKYINDLINLLPNADNIKNILSGVENVVKNTSCLVNIISFFYSIIKNSNNTELSVNSFLTPTQIHKILINYIIVNSIDGNGKKLSNQDGEPYVRMGKVDALGDFEDAFPDYKNHPSKNVEKIFKTCIGAMGGKVVNSLNYYYSMIDNPIGSEDNPAFLGNSKNTINITSLTKAIVGGKISGNVKPKINKNCFELYTRIPLLMNWYTCFINQVNVKKNNDGNKLVIIVPSLVNKYSELFNIYFNINNVDGNGKYEEKQHLVNRDINILIQVINNCYSKFKNSKNYVNDICVDIVKSFNDGFYIIKKDDLVKYKEEISKTKFRKSDITPSDNINTKPNVIYTSSNSKMSDPSREFVKKFSKTNKNDVDMKYEKLKRPFSSDDVNAFFEGIKECTPETFDENNQFDIASFAYSAKNHANTIDDSDKLYDLAVNCINFNNINFKGYNYLLYHETVTLPLRMVHDVFKQLVSFTNTVKELKSDSPNVIKDIMKYVFRFCSGPDAKVTYTVKKINNKASINLDFSQLIELCKKITNNIGTYLNKFALVFHKNNEFISKDLQTLTKFSQDFFECFVENKYSGESDVCGKLDDKNTLDNLNSNLDKLFRNIDNLKILKQIQNIVCWGDNPLVGDVISFYDGSDKWTHLPLFDETNSRLKMYDVEAVKDSLKELVKSNILDDNKKIRLQPNVSVNPLVYSPLELNWRAKDDLEQTYMTESNLSLRRILGGTSEKYPNLAKWYNEWLDSNKQELGDTLFNKLKDKLKTDMGYSNDITEEVLKAALDNCLNNFYPVIVIEDNDLPQENSTENKDKRDSIKNYVEGFNKDIKEEFKKRYDINCINKYSNTYIRNVNKIDQNENYKKLNKIIVENKDLQDTINVAHKLDFYNDNNNNIFNDGLLLQFNRLFACMIRSVCDPYDGKTYRELFEKIVYSKFESTFLGNNSIVDTNVKLNRVPFKGKVPDNTNSILFNSLAQKVKNILKYKGYEGTTLINKYTYDTLDELPVEVRTSLERNLPYFNRLFQIIENKCNIVGQFINAMNNEESIDNKGGEVIVLKASDKNLTNFTSSYDIHDLRIISKTIKSFSDHMKNNCRNMYNQLNDKPQFLEIYKNSISEYKVDNNGSSPLTPLGFVYGNVNSGKILPCSSKDSTHKILYGSRKLLADNGNVNVSDLDYFRNIVDKSNIILNPRNKITGGASNVMNHEVSVIELMRFINDCNYSGIINTNVSNIESLSKSTKLNLNNALNYDSEEMVLKHVCKLYGDENKTIDNIDLQYINLRNMQVSPVNINALMKYVPFVQVNAYSKIFCEVLKNERVREMYTSKLCDDIINNIDCLAQQQYKPILTEQQKQELLQKQIQIEQKANQLKQQRAQNQQQSGPARSRSPSPLPSLPSSLPAPPGPSSRQNQQPNSNLIQPSAPLVPAQNQPPGRGRVPTFISGGKFNDFNKSKYSDSIGQLSDNYYLKTKLELFLNMQRFLRIYTKDITNYYNNYILLHNKEFMHRQFTEEDE